MSQPPVDLTKLRAQLALLDAGSIRALLDLALDELTPDAMARVFKNHVHLDRMRITQAVPPTLLEEVEDFHARALRGEFYEVLHHRHRGPDESRGTQVFHATFGRLEQRCVEAPRVGHEAEIRRAFELLFDLMRQIDECRDDIVSWSDEGGAWQLGVDWPAVMAAWCPCVAAASTLEEYRAAVAEVSELMSSAERARVQGVLDEWVPMH